MSDRTGYPDYRLALAVGLLASAGIHAFLFLADPPIGVDAGPERERALELVALQERQAPTPPAPRVSAPEVPEPVYRPGPPMVADEVPPTEEPHYIAHDIPPKLENFAQVQLLLESLYPDEYRSDGIGGVVELWLYVDDRGEVKRVLLQQPSPHEAFNSAARQVAHAMEFRPAFNHGKAVGIWVAQPIRFVAILKKAAERTASSKPNLN